MLDNEPTTEAAGTAATAQQQPGARKTAKKVTAKKTTAKRTVKKTAAAEVPTQSDGEVADPAPATARKTAAKKAVAKKTTVKKAAAKTAAKKTATKRPAKKATAQDAFPELIETDAPETILADGGPIVENAPATAQRTTRKRTAKKAAQADLRTENSPVTDGPVVDAETPAAASAPTESRSSRRTRSRGRSTDTTASGQTTTASGQTGTADGQADTGAGSAAGETNATAGTDTAHADINAESGATRSGSRRRGSNAPSASTDEAPSTPSTDNTAGQDTNQADEPTTRRTRRRAPAAAPVLFQAPVDVPAQAPAQAAATSPVEATPEVVETTGAEPSADEQPTTTRRRRSRRGRDTEARDTEARDAEAQGDEPREGDQAPAEPSRRSRAGSAATGSGQRPVEVADEDETAEAGQTDEHADAQSEDGEDGGEGTRRRRRRRGGRRRRKSGDTDAEDTADEQSDEDDQDEPEAEAGSDDEHDGSADSDEDGDASGSSSRRRRRRRRRKGEEGAGAADDPDETVVRVREPRSKNTVNEITAVEGSTRLEAKKQRRREGRAAGRRRAPIVTEAEFLARRESVERTMVIRARGDLTQIAVSEDNVLVEHYVAQEEQVSLIGNVYLGRVQNVLPSMEAAFIDIGKGRNAVLYAGEVDWATLGGANGPRKIEQVLKSGQAVLVQVTKDPIGHKGARLTNQISLPGRYVVYVPRGGNGGISRKLPDTERSRLKGILKDIVPDEAGVIVRTAAEGASEEELTADVSRLQKYWTDIDKKSKSGQAPQLLHGEPDLLIRVVRDLFTEDFTKLVISGDDAYDQVREYVSDVAPHLADRVEKWSGDGDVFSNFRIDEQIKKALDRKVWLPSGGSLIIDRTEAMTVVDVNTGKFTGSGGNLEETVTKNNLEAAEEIVRQLRLRDIGGIIVIDFIDMVLESNRDLVLRRLVECLGRDRTKHQVAEVTSLGLVQMTRKRIGTGLLEAFSENCDHCGGRGLILHDEPKESRRRDSRNGQDNNKPAAQAEEPRKSSRRRGRGKGRAEDEHTEEASQHNGDAAHRLAQIAAASAKKDEDATGTDEGAVAEAGAGTPEPTGYPVSARADEQVSPEATGFPAAADTATTVSTDAAEPAEAAPNGSAKSGSTRRRRSSRGRGKGAQAAGGESAGEGDAGSPGADAPELVSTSS
ncbi:Rne/Rng family ribonuclease [Kribbella sp. NBC_01484]|uniref:Rne/Rng family ribonuclease n=1 Tax=Kribbella sp. NBC_01484 TaxID=2903579 RepID=UPI002E313E7D|nr:Rne/Rng family ribonuclease [Kribbella sp. NBC_01484]